MGTWGTAVEADDTFQDAFNLFEDSLKQKQSIVEATKATLASFKDSLEDIDEGPSILFAVIQQQWLYGQVDPGLLAQIQVPDFGLANWQEASPELICERKAAIEKFIRRVSTANPDPRKLPRRTIRKPRFSPGDCLAFQFEDGRYTGGYVLATNRSDLEHGRDLIVMLDYLERLPPPLNVFDARHWLRPDHGKWGGRLDCSWYGPEKFRTVAKRISVVGSVPVPGDAPKDANSHKRWDGFGYQILYIERLKASG